MSLVRSIDRSDLGGATVTLNGTNETIVLIGPTLQTPKDTSFVVFIGNIQINTTSGTTGVVLRVRQGATLSGAQIGQPYIWSEISGAIQAAATIMVSGQVNFTDYVQWCLTASTPGATVNCVVNAATILTLSF